ncbi:amidohydrolase family protein [Paenibacillus spongiae]|uniref:Amidohydrolase family protein n=1 Tax=Paenibacillus spongiae TaxID=2909671 RepID=A0ABY5S5Y8_9BACL|nr:amidohydrolase family protein [Paenibacillus spongiae]UVI29316.1 amidohydrolase family protein [Paenibacillus spongiae]
MEIQLINASLPLEDESRLYAMHAQGGRWTSVAVQDEDVCTANAVRLSDIEGLPETGRPIDLEGRMVLPGFVDAHMHLDKATSIAAVGNRSGTLREAIDNYGAKVAGFTKAEIKQRIVSTALMALSRGTTHIRTHLDFHLNQGREIAFRTMEAALEAREELKGRISLQLIPMCSFERMGAAGVEAAEELLKLGMDGLGGAPHLGSDPKTEISRIFALASRYGVPVDFHADESDDPARRTVVPIAHRTIEYEYGGRATAGHLCSLASMPPGEAGEIIGLMAEARLAAVTLPAVNLYLQGREDCGPIRRGVTRVKELLAAGVPVAVASDNIQDPFHPFGRADLVQIATIASYAAHMGGADELRALLRMITEVPAAIMQLEDYGIREGLPASFVIVDARSVQRLFIEESPSRWVVSNGRWVSAAVRREWSAAAPAVGSAEMPR